MTNNLRLLLCIIAVCIFLLNFTLFKKGRIPLKFVLIWFFSAFVILFVGLFPRFLLILTKLLGFYSGANMVTGVLFVILISISIALTVIISGQSTKITLLIQEVSMLKTKIGEKEDQND